MDRINLLVHLSTPSVGAIDELPTKLRYEILPKQLLVEFCALCVFYPTYLVSIESIPSSGLLIDRFAGQEEPCSSWLYRHICILSCNLYAWFIHSACQVLASLCHLASLLQCSLSLCRQTFRSALSLALV